MGKFSLLLGPVLGGVLAVVLSNDFQLGVIILGALALNNIIGSHR